LEDSKEYINKKKFFDSVITLYGRNVVAEVLEDMDVEIHKLHMSKSNQIDGTIKKINALAKTRGVEVVMHDKKSLSRISKNSKQDQGVAVDIVAKTYKSADEIKGMKSYRLIALDGIQNPQNLGMIVRSCAAGYVDGIILPKKSSAKISPLVIKASAGTLFKLPIFYCNALEDLFVDLDADIYTLSSHAENSIYDLEVKNKSIFVLGNESDGVSNEVSKLCTKSVSIPMNRGVESLNVAVTASLIAFMR
jgi:23S rRNA (guanosine2251-2'-O)-methyltransferase